MSLSPIDPERLIEYATGLPEFNLNSNTREYLLGNLEYTGDMETPRFPHLTMVEREANDVLLMVAYLEMLKRFFYNPDGSLPGGTLMVFKSLDQARHELGRLKRLVGGLDSEGAKLLGFPVKFNAKEGMVRWGDHFIKFIPYNYKAIKGLRLTRAIFWGFDPDNEKMEEMRHVAVNSMVMTTNDGRYTLIQN